MTIAPSPFPAARRVDAGDLSVAYFDLGDPQADPVVLLHGYPYEVHSYVEVAPMLVEAGYRRSSRICAATAAPSSAIGTPLAPESRRRSDPTCWRSSTPSIWKNRSSPDMTGAGAPPASSRRCGPIGSRASSR